jgi:hypothetical protein
MSSIAPAAATLLAMLLPVGAAAQVAERPAVRVGDEWQFAVYYATPTAVPNRTWRVLAVSENGITGTEDGKPLRLTADLNPVESPLLRQSNGERLRFPLRLGMRWSYVNDVQFLDNGSKARVHSDVEVVGYETIRVAAGEFQAFRLQARGRFQGTSYAGAGSLQGESTSTYWYAPAARTVVKSVHRSTYRGEETVELVRSRLQP